MMTDATKRRIVNKIRHQRALLTTDEMWWQQQTASDARAEGFREINFWRNVLRDAERRLEVGDSGEAGSEYRPALAGVK